MWQINEIAAWNDPKVKIIIGGLPQPGLRITIVDPYGNAQRITSGQKPEYGAGGFEVLAPHRGVWTIEFAGQVFRVNHDNDVTYVTWIDTADPDTPPPTPIPEPGPPPPPEPPENDLTVRLSVLEGKVAGLEGNWAAFFDQLDRIETMLRGLVDDPEVGP